MIIFLVRSESFKDVQPCLSVILIQFNTLVSSNDVIATHY